MLSAESRLLLLCPDHHAGGVEMRVAPDAGEARFTQPARISLRAALDVGRAPADVLEAEQRAERSGVAAIVQHPATQNDGAAGGERFMDAAQQIAIAIRGR